MKTYAKHRVYVWLVNETMPHPQDKGRLVRLIPTGELISENEIEHPEECDQLKYDERCFLDLMRDYCDDEMPVEPGVYDVWAVQDGMRDSWSGEWEDDSYIDFERVGDLPEPYNKYNEERRECPL